MRPFAKTMRAVGAEVCRARTKFPGNAHLMTALMEEVGELAKAFLDGRPMDEIQMEAIQIACVAIRICEEGDDDFRRVYKFPWAPLYESRGWKTTMEEKRE